jgi:hypothetical protein
MCLGHTFTDTAELKLIDNNNAGTPGIVRSSDDAILCPIFRCFPEQVAKADGSLVDVYANHLWVTNGGYHHFIPMFIYG